MTLNDTAWQLALKGNWQLNATLNGNFDRLFDVHGCGAADPALGGVRMEQRRCRGRGRDRGRDRGRELSRGRGEHRKALGGEGGAASHS